MEYVAHNIELFKAKQAPDEPVTIRQGDARDLSFFEDERFDLTLVLRPLYHLFTMDDKRAAISDALRVTKKGGTVFADYCSSDAT